MNRFHITAADLEHMTQLARVSSYEPDKTVWTELAVYFRRDHNRPWVAVVEGKTDDIEKVDRFKSFSAGTVDRAMRWFEGGHLRDRLAEKVDIALVDQFAEMVDRNGPHAAELTGDRHHEASVDRRGGRIERIIADEIDDFLSLEPAGNGTLGAERIPLLGPDDTIKVQAPNGHRYSMIRSVGISTDRLVDALRWLYPDAASDSARTVLLEKDFGMPARTTRRALAVEDGGAAGEPGAWVALFLVSMRFFDRELWVAGGCSATIASVEG